MEAFFRMWHQEQLGSFEEGCTGDQKALLMLWNVGALVLRALGNERETWEGDREKKSYMTSTKNEMRARSREADARSHRHSRCIRMKNKSFIEPS